MFNKKNDFLCYFKFVWSEESTLRARRESSEINMHLILFVFIIIFVLFFFSFFKAVTKFKNPL